ncbi:TonB-dependent receptor domain-containing protein, partial [Enterobacter hormaechei]|uniref:TonB-dependent receptor domain-containing protein n=1 Tax=Enterobacter hormaechei TaxID=158836 RepID=UPI00203EE8EC
MRQQYYTQIAQVKTKQSAQYIEDRWQVTDNLLLQLGLRNETFKNYTSAGEVYVKQDNQWAPRLGAVWDVHGDSTLKLFANAGR